MKYFYVPAKMNNGYDFETTFHFDFDIADHFGIDAIKDTFVRSFKCYKNNIEYITELAIVLNMRCWFWHGHGNESISRIYGDLYYKCRDHVYDNIHFNKMDRDYYFKMTD